MAASLKTVNRHISGAVGQITTMSLHTLHILFYVINHNNYKTKLALVNH